MKCALTVAALSTGMAGAAVAGAIDRSGQPIRVLFEEGTYAEVQLTYTNPDLDGEDVVVGGDIDNVAGAFVAPAFGFKTDLTDRWSIAIIGDEDYGSDIQYGGNPLSTALGGTIAIANTYTVSAIGRYKFTENWSAYGGLRASYASGRIKLNGLAYGGPTAIDPGTGMIIGGGVSGYNVDLDDDLAFGYMLGAAYEIPDISLRVALTYFSPITYEFGSEETFAFDATGDAAPDFTRSFESDDTSVDAPQAVNLDFQSGVAADTLLFGSVRWANWSAFEIEPERFTGQTGVGLVDLDDVVTYTLGVGRQFTDQFAASFAYQYEDPTDRLVSPLSPTTGLNAVILGASYRFDQLELSGGFRYAWLGNAKPETGTPDVQRADFTDNTAVSVGVRLGYFF